VHVPNPSGWDLEKANWLAGTGADRSIGAGRSEIGEHEGHLDLVEPRLARGVGEQPGALDRAHAARLHIPGSSVTAGIMDQPVELEDQCLMTGDPRVKDLIPVCAGNT
jgi:hypothetical protein